MSVRINLGNWGSIFAVPTAVVDKHLKIASPMQTKVLLYLLRNSEKSYTYKEIADFFAVDEEDIADCVSFWLEREVLVESNGELVPSVAENKLHNETEQPAMSEKKLVQPRLTKPDIISAAQRVSADAVLQHLLAEVEVALSKPLSSGDVATVVMLYDTCGLPCEVVLMLVHYCVSIGKGNMRTIEKIGVNWADMGINTLGAADSKINEIKQSTANWNIVKGVFGLANVGSPTQKQLEYAQKWIGVWHFSTDMLRKAYEICVDTTGKFTMNYIDKVLQRWFNAGVINVDDIQKLEAQKPATKGSKKRSFDINELDKIK